MGPYCRFLRVFCNKKQIFKFFDFRRFRRKFSPKSWAETRRSMCDHRDANAALSQLSYRPINSFDIYRLYHGRGQKSSKFSYLFSASKIYVSKNARGQCPVGSLPRSLLSPQPVSRQTPAPPQTKKLQNECSAAFGADEGT